MFYDCVYTYAYTWTYTDLQHLYRQTNTPGLPKNPRLHLQSASEELTEFKSAAVEEFVGHFLQPLCVRHTYRWAMSHIWMGRVTRMYDFATRTHSNRL